MLVVVGCFSQETSSPIDVDAGVQTVVQYVPGPAIQEDGTSLSTCECVVDGDCQFAFLGTGPCQRASCNADTCQCVINEVFDDDPCDDGDLCTTGTVCSSGACIGGVEISCEDGNLCTTDVCERELGCVYENTSSPCDDGDACTESDTCIDGSCAGGAAPDCSDNNPCTLNGCDPVLGCTVLEHRGECDDGDACTNEDTCGDGECAGSPVICDDGLNCTLDWCDSLFGCLAAPEEEGTLCEDGDPCTTDDFVRRVCVNPVREALATTRTRASSPFVRREPAFLSRSSVMTRMPVRRMGVWKTWGAYSLLWNAPTGGPASPHPVIRSAGASLFLSPVCAKTETRAHGWISFEWCMYAGCGRQL